MQHKLFNWTVNCQGYVRPGLAYFDRQESTQKWWHFTTKNLETIHGIEYICKLAWSSQYFYVAKARLNTIQSHNAWNPKEPLEALKDS